MECLIKSKTVKIISITLAILFVTSVVAPVDDAFAGNGSKACYHSDCSFPTLGVDTNGKRLVWGGFSYNGQTVDATSYYTEFPLITTKVGKQNTAVLKITDNQGGENVRHVALGFGIAKGSFFGDAHTSITLDIDHRGEQTVFKTDPHNAIGAYSVTTQMDRIGNGFPSILEVTIRHKFVSELPFNIVSVNVWDEKKNARQFFFNDGVKVIDPNKPTEKVEEFVSKEKTDEGVTMHGYDRAHPRFDTYKQGQELLAKQVLAKICPSCINEPYEDIPNTLAYEISEPTIKANNVKLQKISDKETINTEQKHNVTQDSPDSNIDKSESTRHIIYL